MSLRKRRIIGYLLIIFLLIAIEGCGTDYSSSSEKQQSLKKIILTDNVWGRVTIDDKVTTKNVAYFLSKLHPSKLKPSDLILETAIKAQLISQDSQKEMYFNEGWAYDGKKVYEGKDTNSLFAILIKDLYSANQLSTMVKNSSTATLFAKDINKTYEVGKKHNLAQAVSVSLQLAGDSEQVLKLPPDFPFYQVNMRLKNSKRVEVIVISPEFFVVNDLERLRVFSKGNKVWEYCVANLGKPIPGPNQISYLFQSDSIRYSKGGGDLLPKKKVIVRVLTGGKLVEKKPVNLKNNYEMTFKVKGQIFEVQVYENHFYFNGRYYSLPKLMNILENVISSG